MASSVSRGDAFRSLPNSAERYEALRPFFTNGPGFIRRVRDSLIRAHNSWETEGAGANLVEAEIAAGLRTVEDWPGRYTPEVFNTQPAK